MSDEFTDADLSALLKELAGEGPSMDIIYTSNEDIDAIHGADEIDAIIERMGDAVETGRYEEQLDPVNIMDLLAVGGADEAAKKVIKEYPQEEVGDIDASITAGDMLLLIYSEIQRKRIAGHHIDSMNSFNNVGVKQIATDVFVVEGRLKNQRDKSDEDKEVLEVSFRVEFTDINLTSPTTTKYKSGTMQMLTPNMARVKGLTYSATLYIDATITATAYYKNGGTKTRTGEIKNHRIAAIPCQIGTELCNTFNCSKAALRSIEEDPQNPGGYFIIKGFEWTIDNLENIANNTFHAYKNMHMNEIARGIFLSKPGDAFENSYQIILRYLNTGAITIEMTTNKFNGVEIPYYLIFRALGMTRDIDIVNHIVYGVNNEDPVTKTLMEILEKAFECEDARFGSIRKSTDPTEIIQHIAYKVSEESLNTAAGKKDDNIAKYLNGSVLNMIDKHTFPHIGTGVEHRIKKLRFLGHLINKLLCVYMGVLEPTDRDSYRNKRVSAAGTSMAKTFKTDFNLAIVNSIKKQLMKDFKSTPFSNVRLEESVKSAINSDDLERMLMQAIITGNKTITVKRNEVTNRISSQTLYHKNDLNVKSTLNTINTPNTSASKQNERADEMRRVHPTYLGYVDPSQSADTGEKVGMTKQLACTASICGASSSFIMRKILSDDPDILDLDKVSPEQISQGLAKIFVNGNWVGCCNESHKLVAKYRTMRRHGDIHHLTTIVWEPLIREVHFWTDVGRLMRPLIIVYNNIEEYIADKRAGKNEVQFNQWIKLTKDHIRGLQTHKITMDSLREDRVIEYISPEEQENTLLAFNIDTLRKNANNVTRRYTHCDIDQAMFGVITLAAPMADHSSATRNTFYTNHRKQSAGWFALNYPFRIDKNTTLQHYCEHPLISTFSDALTSPNGQNVIVALALHGGENMEDSITGNQGSIDCGAFNASFYNYEKAELEKGEQFGNPDYSRTMDIKKDASYEHVKGGFVSEGTEINKGDVLIVKAVKLPKPDDQYLYADKSVVYTRDEKVRVERVVVSRNDEDVLTAKVKTRSSRPLDVGDKLCLTPDHEVLTDRGWASISSISLNDKIACHADGYLQYHNPTKLYQYHHAGDMFEINNPDINQCVTMEHKMLIIDGLSPKLVPASELINKSFTCKKNILVTNTEHRISARTIIETLAPVSSLCRDSSVNFHRTILTAGWSASVKGGKLTIEKINNEPECTGNVIQYTGKVYCVEVPPGVFYVRRNGIPSWTGNSSRTGNKGICAVKRCRSDMPFRMDDGVIPDIIVNAHSIPTRMAVNQILEGLLAQVAAKLGVHIDATTFRVHDFHQYMKILENHGVKYGGHSRVMNGMTGDWIDTLIYIIPNTYQRLQKYVIDEHYAIRTGPSAAMTRQPLEGKNNGGGLRIGEMEKDVICAQGVGRALCEKFGKDSDGFNIPHCRVCGKIAIVNESQNIYRCKTCGDQADIVIVPLTWVANICRHEISALGVEQKIELAPHLYPRAEV